MPYFLCYQGYVSATGLEIYTSSVQLFIDCPTNTMQMMNIALCTLANTYTKVDHRRIVKIPILNITADRIYFDLAIFQKITKAVQLSLKVTYNTPTYHEQLDA